MLSFIRFCVSFCQILFLIFFLLFQKCLVTITICTIISTEMRTLRHFSFFLERVVFVDLRDFWSRVT